GTRSAPTVGRQSTQGLVRHELFHVPVLIAPRLPPAGRLAEPGVRDEPSRHEFTAHKPGAVHAETVGGAIGSGGAQASRAPSKYALIGRRRTSCNGDWWRVRS